MIYHALSPSQSLNKAYRKEKVARKDIELFKSKLREFLESINEKESEEHVKNNVTKFLYETYYQGKNQINTKGRIDLAIYEDKKPVVIIEAKRPNSPDMVSSKNLNAKAMHELMLYYLRERIEEGNNDIKFLVVTNMYEWYVFDALVFEKLFYKDHALTKDFNDWKNGRKSGDTTDFFYTDIAFKFLKSLKEEITFTKFDLREIEKIAANKSNADDHKLIPIFKFLSPAHLLKQPFANDSNSLDTKFYSELLHIIGLEEKKDKGKKIIQRKEKPDPASVLENAIATLVSDDKLRKLPEGGKSFGATEDERLFNVALELCITWINRVLFLKLLEGQLLIYHGGDKAYRFLDFKEQSNFDQLNKLFFDVLAKVSDKRPEAIRKKYAHVPYLNSSLFDFTPLEEDSILIKSLDDSLRLKLASNTVLKSEGGKKREGDLPTLQYLFEFLDAYDFASEGKEEIQEENKGLINASVLGLIFEKINGYKDGSFFTPGFITMYMCRETIRRAVVQKFNEAKGWKVESFDQLYNEIKDLKEANAIINSLKICDPAVGSGHFLVSALNEVIAIKSELNILSDRSGKVLRGYSVEVINDELIISIDHSEFFEYKPSNKESQRVQEALFHEKQTIIENCLFGVDINPNSVKICRLRLWIELLKNAYYTRDSKYVELETLPNIDINIKQGNSLISRFSLDADLGKALKSIKYSIDDYRSFVSNYKNATGKEEKRGLETLINQIKGDFKSTFYNNIPEYKKLARLKGDLTNLVTTNIDLFGKKRKDDDLKLEIRRLELSIEQHQKVVDEIKNSVVFKDAFEWRFEFPEVLDNEGNFIGFNVIIGNPPYIRIQDLRQTNERIVDYYNTSYFSTDSGNYDLYVPFIELGYKTLASNGDFCFIMPHKFINANYGKKIRQFIADKSFLRKIMHFGAEQVFTDATTYTGLFFMSKAKNDVIEFLQCNDFEDLIKPELLRFQKNSNLSLRNDEWVFLHETDNNLLSRLVQANSTLEDLTERIFQGLKTSADKIYIIEKLAESEDLFKIFCRENDKTYTIEKHYVFPLIKGGDSSPYQIGETNLLILFPYKNGDLVKAEILKSTAPRIWSYLNEHKAFLEERENGKFKGSNWYSFGRSQALDIISSIKIFTPDIAPNPRFSFDKDGRFMFTGGVAGGYGIIPKPEISYKYLLAILNSPVTAWYISRTSTQMRGGWYSFESRYIRSIPIPIQPKDFSELEKKVDQLLLINEANSTVNRAKLEKEINKIVYKIYLLSEEEIKIVEGK
jgi:adenine-specific DNA-methyltransferase